MNLAQKVRRHSSRRRLVKGQQLSQLVLLTLVACAPSRSIEGLQIYHYVPQPLLSGSIRYPSVPPAGGAHNPLWQSCGRYAQPLYDEYVVHSLAHGALWLSHQPQLPPETLQKALDRLGQVPGLKLLVSPYPGLYSPLVLTVWNAQLPLADADDPRLVAFAQQYGDGHTAPEAQAACTQGFEGSKFLSPPSNSKEPLK